MMSVDATQHVYLAVALLVRGQLGISDIRRNIDRADASVELPVVLLSQKVFSSRLKWTAVSTSHRSYHHPQRESNRDSAACEPDTLTTRPHCHEYPWVTGQM
ncbi:unnamed protein product [Protopolystoma xenopodis]|uniref:Uncharacterized protein n=1 Tax=Protopolystoma xenopodis TaxID=117903 RepID=A0A448WXF0_9PLAT|nr:unnamed protein product [Protopolystoma xenopodis]